MVGMVTYVATLWLAAVTAGYIAFKWLAGVSEWIRWIVASVVLLVAFYASYAALVPLESTLLTWAVSDDPSPGPDTTKAENQ